MIQSIGSDDIEDFAIDVCKLADIPAMLLYTPMNSTQMEVDEDIGKCWTVLSGDASMVTRECSVPIHSRLLGRGTLDKFLQSFLTNSVDPTFGPIVLFVAGDRSSVGKSSICMSITASLIQKGAAVGAFVISKQ